MNLYYFASEDEKPEDANEWDIWRLAIPLSKKEPKVGDEVIFISINDNVVRYQGLEWQDEIAKWPFPLTSGLIHEIVKSIFEVK